MKVPNIRFLSMFRAIGRNAFVDWLIILFLNTFIMLSLILGSLYLYWQVSTGNLKVSNVPAKTNKKIFNEKDLEKLIKVFELKADNTTQAKMGYRGPADPSL